MKLYEFPEQFERLGAMLEESMGEVTPEIEAVMANLEGSLEEKVQNILALMREKEALADARKAEADRLARSAKAPRATADRLKNYLLNCLTAMKRREVATGLGTVTVQQNSQPSITVSDAETLPSQWLRTNITVTPDKEKLLDAWKAGGDLPEGVTVEVGSHLRVR